MTPTDAAPCPYSVTCRTMSGEATSLPLLQPTDTVRDLAVSIRSALGIPVSVQHLTWGAAVLKEPSEQLSRAFGGSRQVELTVLRRPFTPEERAELHRRLVRATAAGELGKARDLLREGAQVNFEAEGGGPVDRSRSLSRWEECPEGRAEESAGPGRRPESGGRPEDGAPADGTPQAEEEEEEAEREGEESALDLANPCGGLSPLLVALAAGDGELAQDLRQLGGHEEDPKPRGAGGLKEAIVRKDFPDVARHLACGADVNVLMARGHAMPGTLDEWSIWPGFDPHFGTPLHACAAMHRLPGAYEIAQLLIRLRADLNAGDAEGDSPLAHARFFGARELYALYQGKGAKLAGPFYGRLGE